ncbi:COMM domain-containing protein 10 [Pseudolycoriella hygida]|uniref:COMM domain-containing protein 10 n=1 Tax=Pseudolycoriella hygida TaxID=35572 RepID=A0A9Q0RX06_9DIPT|nr:COMM domain-containing protein 10 [Pseudolycoriella hygida]
MYTWYDIKTETKMNLNWIKITERAAEGIKIINKLDDEVFTTVISYVHKNMSPDETDDDNRGLEELEQLVKTNRPDFLLLIKTLSYILKRASTFPILDNLEIEGGGSRQLEDVNWELKVQLSSEAQQKEKTPIGMLQLGMNAGESVNLEVNHSELLNLYNQLETIQNELDALRSK